MFTLIIPYHNRERFLPRTLQSLLRCTVQPDQIILVDNASSDSSWQVCERFAHEHPDCPVQLISECKPGACHARNKALQMVTEEWVYFFDSDDELSPDYFRDVQLQIQANQSADMIACATVRVYPDGHEVPREVQYSSDPADQILSGQLATQGMFSEPTFCAGLADGIPVCLVGMTGNSGCAPCCISLRWYGSKISPIIACMNTLKALQGLIFRRRPGHCSKL